MKVAHELKQPLHILMGWRGPLTARQVDVWSEWYSLQWNNPGLIEHYLMQVSSVYLNSKLSKEDEKLKPTDFKIPFITVPAGASKEDLLKQRYGDYDPNAPIRPMTKKDIEKFRKVRMGRG